MQEHFYFVFCGVIVSKNLNIYSNRNDVRSFSCFAKIYLIDLHIHYT